MMVVGNGRGGKGERGKDEMGDKAAALEERSGNIDE